MGKLGKRLGLLHVFAISAGAMISSGLFLLPGIAYSMTGPSVVVAYLLSGLLLLPSLMSQAELSTAMPRAGGDYFFISRSLGSTFGTIDGVGVWLALVLKTSIAIVGLGAYLSGVIGLEAWTIALIAGLVFTAANILGGRESGGLQVGMVAVLLGVLLFFAGRGLPELSPGRFRPFLPSGLGGILPATGLVFISYIGLTKAASMAEEVEDPGRNIPLGMLLALGVTLVVYVLVVTVVVGTLPSGDLSGTMTPVTDSARRFMGAPGIVAIGVAALLAFATTANAGMMAASRYVLAMGRDGVVSPALSRLDGRGTPVAAILLTAALVICIALLVDAEHIAKLASSFQLLVFAFLNLSVIVMRESGLEGYDPGFRSPLYPWMQVAGVLIPVVLIPEMGLLSTIFSLGLIGVAVLWHLLYVRRRVSRTGAVSRFARRVAERLLARDAKVLGLERELREILKEKGIRREDPFPELLARADMVELDEGVSVERVLEMSADLLSRRSGVSRDFILGALLQRNCLGETPCESGLALPHVLTDKVEGSYLVLARSRGGVELTGSSEPVRAFFVLLGSMEEPRRHLRTLAEIARRTEQPGFMDRWMGVDLRDLPETVLRTGEDGRA